MCYCVSNTCADSVVGDSAIHPINYIYYSAYSGYTNLFILCNYSKPKSHIYHLHASMSAKMLKLYKHFSNVSVRSASLLILYLEAYILVQIRMK